jgi:hypothetical protein
LTGIEILVVWIWTDDAERMRDYRARQRVVAVGGPDTGLSRAQRRQSSVNDAGGDEHNGSGWFTLVVMSRTLMLTLPDEIVAAVERVAAARGVSIEELVGEWAATADPTPVSGVPRRRLALAGVVSSGGPGISGRVNELLADGFGTD